MNDAARLACTTGSETLNSQESQHKEETLEDLLEKASSRGVSYDDIRFRARCGVKENPDSRGEYQAQVACF
jgi:hypothetical protein